MKKHALIAGACVAALAWDPAAEASDAKRVAILVFALISCAVCVAWPSTTRVRRWPSAWKCGAAFVALSAVSLAWGTRAGVRDLSVWIAGVVIVAAASRMERDEAMDAARSTAVIVGAVSSVHAIVTWCMGARGVAVHGLQGNANWLGLVLVACLPSTLEVARRRRALAVVVVAELVALFLSHARVAWVALAVAAIVTIPWKNMAKSRRALVVAAVALLLVACHGEGREVASDVAIAGRFWIAKHGLHATIASLPFGAGLGRWTHVFLQAQGETLQAMPVREAARRFLFATTAHDDYVQAATESGPLAAMALLAFVVFASRDLLSTWRAGATTTIALGISAFGDDPLHRPAAVILLALVVATSGERGARVAQRDVGAIAGALLCAALLLDATRAWIGARLRTTARGRDPFGRVATLERAARLDPDDGEVDFELGVALLAIDEPQRALDRLQASRARFASVGTFVAMGNAFVALDRTDDAISAYFSAISLDPGSFKAQADVAAALLSARRLDEAETHARVALSLEPGVERVRALIDRIHEAKMDAAVD